MKVGNPPGRGGERTRMLGVDAAFNRHPKETNVVLRDGKRGARGNLDLLIDDVNSGYHFGDRMLDLHPRVHLNEEELPILVQELNRSRANVAQLRHGLGDNSADVVALFWVQSRGGTFLPYLLVATLKGAIALAKVNGVALRVAEHLNFDVAWLGEVLLQIHGIVAECGSRLDLGRTDRLGNVVGAVCDFHTAAAPAGGGLDDDRIADLVGDLARLGFVPNAGLGSRDARQPQTLSSAFGLDLVAHQADVFGLGADECDLVLIENIRETRVLGEKTVARMNGVSASDLACRDNRRNVEIAVARRRRPDAYALIGQLDVHRLFVGG